MNDGELQHHVGMETANEGWLLSLTELGVIEECDQYREGALALEVDQPVGSMMILDYIGQLVPLLVASLVAATLVVMALNGMAMPSSVGVTVPFMIGTFGILIFWVLSHEAAHLLAARLNGYTHGFISFFSDGMLRPRFVTRLGSGIVDPVVRCRVYLAGPVVDDIFCIASCLSSLYYFRSFFSWLNAIIVMIYFVSALPFTGTDMNQVLSTSTVWGRNHLGYRMLQKFQLLVLYSACVAGLTAAISLTIRGLPALL